ncbi:MAG: ABC transporter permease [Bacillota bacterium]|nr:ABC transporter permease [Bacillota bacterium]
MNQFWVLTQREFRQMAGSTGYKVTTVVALVLVVALAFLPALMDWLGSMGTSRVAVLDQGTGLAPALEQAVKAQPSAGRLALQPWRGPADQAAVEQAVRAGRVSGVLWLRPSAGPEAVSARYISKDRAEQAVAVLSAALSQASLPLRLERAGISPAAFQAAMSPLVIRQVALEPKSRPADFLVTQGLGYFLMIFLYVALAMYGSMMLYSVTTEKTSRIAEVLLVATRPATILLSKLAGLGAAGLLQFLLMMLVGLGVALLRGLPSGLLPGALQAGGELKLSTIPVGAWAWMVVFFLVGFLMYSALYAAMGAMVSRTEEAQNAAGLPSMLMMVAYFVAIFAVVSPESRVATIGSFVPFLTPMIMFLRVLTLPVPIWEPFLGLAINLAALWLLIRWAARVYQENLLVQQPFSLRRAFRLRPRSAA